MEQHHRLTQKVCVVISVSLVMGLDGLLVANEDTHPLTHTHTHTHTQTLVMEHCVNKTCQIWYADSHFH